MFKTMKIGLLWNADNMHFSPVLQWNINTTTRAGQLLYHFYKMCPEFRDFVVEESYRECLWGERRLKVPGSVRGNVLGFPGDPGFLGHDGPQDKSSRHTSFKSQSLGWDQTPPSSITGRSSQKELSPVGRKE